MRARATVCPRGLVESRARRERRWSRFDGADARRQGEALENQRESPDACPHCGGELTAEGWASSLCLPCLMGLGLSRATSTDGSGLAEVPTEDGPPDRFTAGMVLGKRYRLRSLLGQGGMGEVWRAFDLKLRVDVALKSVLESRLADERMNDALRQEVRAAREVVSPQVCRVFDFVELDGHEMVSMEFVDGTALSQLLREKSPRDLDEARAIAAQLLAGLEAIHAAGLVHRDIKPENIMVTRTGRVVVMDFGLAKGMSDGRVGTISGTPAYMSPEQARGEPLDARADLFSAGIVLAELVAPGGVRSASTREKVWRGAHEDPPVVDESPWDAVLRRVLARNREQRFVSASQLSRALEEVTLRGGNDEKLRPYPGLASFTAADAEYFFGRELEVEEIWKKLRRPHLLGLIGPSGAGKSSFLRAGLIPTAPADWRIVYSTPSNRPFTALAQAFVPELAGDQSALADLLQFERLDVALPLVSRWRKRHGEALVILDQFEELFTQNPPEVQARFAELTGRLAIDADVHVLLAMRDDFLFHCAAHPALSPAFSELMPLRTPEGDALRRALVQPALKCGYRFADDTLIDEMIGEVRGERGALPLLAFAMSRLWENRDRENGVLTRQAYEAIGGVAGALAQHAEMTLARIGGGREAIVRDIFRNLVTAQGTRATRDRDDLISIFPEADRAAAGAIVAQLVDARLLVSFEAETGG